MRILGIDCGTERTGFGVIESDGRDHGMIAAGAIRTSPRDPLETRLLEIAQGLRKVIQNHTPGMAAVEEVFYAQNVKTALKLSHARGVAMLTVAEAGLALGEYSPLEIKTSVAGYGRAEKHQVRMMVHSLLGLTEEIESEDACDALAVAICHATRSSSERRVAQAFLPVFLFAAIFAANLSAATIEYSKYFKGSVPEYVEISIDQSGAAVYKEAKDDDRPLKFQVQPELHSQIVALSDKLDRFNRPLESPLKVAHMGIKTFRFDDGATKGEVKFNFSEDTNAQQLADCFERITETEQDYVILERAVKFDKLGVQDALFRLLMTYEKKRLVAPEQFLPLLDRVIKNESYMHIARDRAATLADAIRNPVLSPKGEK